MWKSDWRRIGNREKKYSNPVASVPNAVLILTHLALKKPKNCPPGSTIIPIPNLQVKKLKVKCLDDLPKIFF